MILYAAQGTSNLGDFFNCFPVLSGLSKVYGNLDLIIQNDMERFNGILELISYQPFIKNVVFEKDWKGSDPVIPFNSWVDVDPDMYKISFIRPIETERYYRRFLEYNAEFSVDDDFILQIPEIKVPVYETVIADRCSVTSHDKRRSCDLIKSSGKHKGDYLDYTKPLIYNLNVVKNAKIFITTFTGISVLVDLMGLYQLVVYDEEMETWGGRTDILQTFNGHYYFNRNTNLEKYE